LAARFFAFTDWNCGKAGKIACIAAAIGDDASLHSPHPRRHPVLDLPAECQSLGASLAMRAAKDFWAALSVLATCIEHAPGTEQLRRRQVVAAYLDCGPLGRETLRNQLRVVLDELNAIHPSIDHPGVPKEPERST
jgi:hypothetical protein